MKINDARRAAHATPPDNPALPWARIGISRANLATLTRLAIGLVIMVLIVIGLTRPSAARTPSGVGIGSTPSSPRQQQDSPDQFARCLQDWDAGTHMTKQEWSGACQRLLLERETICASIRNNSSRAVKVAVGLLGFAD
jgi:hypothetical protein